MTTQKFPSLKKTFCSFLIVTMTAMCWQFSVAQAGMIGTQELVSQQQHLADRAKVMTFLERDAVERAILTQGVMPAEVRLRVAALTDEEISQLAGQIDKLPAGAGLGSVVGAVVFVFVVLLVTDILGYTKVFSFTRPIR